MNLSQARNAVENGLLQRVKLAGQSPKAARLGERMEAHGTPGLSIALVNEGEVAWCHGYGVAEIGASRPVTPESLFQAGSISKPVAAAVALRLVDDGAIDLDRDVNEVLRSWHVPENEFTRVERVTVRRILAHRAGLTVHGFAGYKRGNKIPSLLHILDGTNPANSNPIRVDLVPGSAIRYSGGGYVLLQMLIEDVTGRGFASLAEELVLRPLGMLLSTFEQPLPEARHAEAATAHWATGERVPGGWHVYPELPAAGLWTTPSDLGRFAMGVLDAFAGRSNAVLSQDLARAMLSPQGDASRGLGFGLKSSEHGVRFSHGGSNAGYESWLFGGTESEEAVIVQTNAAWGDVLGLEVVRGLALELPWLGMQCIERDVAELTDDEISAVAGVYESDDPFEDATERFNLRREGGVLVTPASKHAGAMRFHPASRDEWFECALGMTLTIHRDQGGAVIGFTDDLWEGEARRVGR